MPTSANNSQSSAQSPELATYMRNPSSSAAIAIITNLGIVVDHLHGIATDIEESVLGVCRGFQGMSTRARQAVATASIVLDEDCEGNPAGSGMSRIRTSLATLLCRLETSHDFSVELCDRIGEMEERLDLVVRLGEKIIEMAQDTEQTAKRTLLPMRRNSQTSGTYDSVWPQFEAVTQSCQTVGQQICALVAALRSMTKDSINRAKIAAEQDRQALQSSDRTIRITLDSMSTAYERMNDSLARSSAMNSQLNLDIGQAVMSMQFQDRINQRIEHIVTTVQEIDSDLRPLTAMTNEETVRAITELWTRRWSEKSTMAAERQLQGAPPPSSPEDSIELF